MGKESTRSTPRKVDGQNRVALPAEVMEALGVERGGHVAFEIEGKEVRVIKVRWVPER